MESAAPKTPTTRRSAPIAERHSTPVPHRGIPARRLGIRHPQVPASLPVRHPARHPVRGAKGLNLKKFNELDKNTKVGVIAVAAAAAVVLVILIVVCVNLFGGRSYNKVADIYLKATFDGDAKSIVNLVHKDVLAEEMDNAGYEKNEKNDYIKAMNKQLKRYLDMMDDEYDDWKVTYKIKDAEDLERSELKDLKEDYDDRYDVKITDAKIVTVRVTISYDGDKDTDNMEVYTVKIGGSWYLDTVSMGGMGVF